ncbi:inovirus Gp2 family protein [Shewanella sp. 10N.286.51.B8]|uniref:inovirus Gp2 family protein n=1 Tax=Shewanella sp. 10N.286.51.B8 TaxID=3229708 RepID=UPI00354E3638
MNVRHQNNKNLVLHNGSSFNGVAVNANYQLIENHLCSIQRVIGFSLEEHKRTLVVRVDLHLPVRPDCVDYPMEFDTNVISRFMASLKAQVQADLLNKMKQGKRVHPCTVRYVWVKERHEALQDHYHVALFFNHDSYFNLGDYNQFGNNLSTKITTAWASALAREAFQAAPLVHFPQDTPYYCLDMNAVTFHQDYQSVFNRLSYLAKVDTKHYGDRSHSFGASRK